MAPQASPSPIASWALVLLTGLALASPCRAAVLRGELHTPGSGRTESVSNPYAGQAGSIAGVAPTVRGVVTDAVIYLERIPAAAESALARDPQHPALVQRHQSFEPRVLAVAIGTVVEFPNQDPIYHNVFSVSPIKRFDLGKYPKGHSKRLTFERAGLCNVYCDIHSNMAAYILVLANHAFTQPNAEGAFAFPALPPGHYALHVWHPDLPPLERAVDLPADGLALDLRY